MVMRSDVCHFRRPYTFMNRKSIAKVQIKEINPIDETRIKKAMQLRQSVPPSCAR